MKRPARVSLRHLALRVKDVAACERFYTDIIGMRVEWRPDADNVYLTTGDDNLALHRAPAGLERGENQPLDHIGFIVPRVEQVDEWYNFLMANNVPVEDPPHTHRDGARSLYCRDPDGNTVQLIYHPSIDGV